MAATIIPIQLSLTAGDVITLWAPRWEEDGEEWEAFLGHGEHLFALPDAAHLTAFIRTATEHDLTDHPSWELASRAVADELIPTEDHRFNITGVPELVAGPADLWSLAELTDTVAILQSLAEVCDLPVIDEVLGSSAGFAAAATGPNAFLGRSGRKLWNEVGSVVAKRWAEVVAALDALVAIPQVDDEAVAAAQAEIDSVAATDQYAVPAGDEDASDFAEEQPRDPELEFWDEVGIDCISVRYEGRTGWGLRCFLDDAPVFLTIDRGIALFRSPAALEEYLTDPAAQNSLSDLDAWGTIREAITSGDASVLAGSENSYVIDGVDDQLLGDPMDVDGDAVALAVELVTDAAASRRDDEAAIALGTATPLGNLIRAVTHPDPDRLPPSPPFDDEVAAWRALVETFATHLDWRDR